MRKLIRLTVIAFVIGAVLCGLGYYGSRDAPPPEDEDLEVERPDIPAEENAWTYFARAAERVRTPERGDPTDLLVDILAMEKWDQAFAEKWIRKNEEALREWREGLERSGCVMPKPENWLTAEMPELEGFRSLARMAALRAVYLHREGRNGEAFDECLRIVRFGHMIVGARGPHITYLVGIAVKAIGLMNWQGFLREATLSPGVLKSYVRQLQRYQRNASGFRDVARVEYEACIQIVDDWASQESNGRDLRASPLPPGLVNTGLRGFFWKPNKTRRAFARVARAGTSNAENVYAKLDLSGMPELPENQMEALRSGNPIGQLLLAMLLPAYRRVHAERCKMELMVSATRVLFALRAYEQERGRLPASLNELVPEYIDSVPRDPFDGKPLRYSWEKTIIYSVGEDLEDSGGSEGEERWEMADPTFEIEFGPAHE